MTDGAGRYFLVGFMGAGKTTLGAALARRLGLPFYDLDELIERRTGKRIEEIFAAHGEAGFRRIETEVLRSVIEAEPGIVATGGGTFTRPENRALIRAAGRSIWLDAPADTLLRRGADGPHRPLWTGEEAARRLLERRRADYRLADLRLELGGQAPDEAVERLVELLAGDGQTITR